MPSTNLTFASRAAHRAWLAAEGALPAGFRVGTVRFDFVPREAPKPAKMTLTLIALDRPTPDFAAVFTRNAFPGAPVIVGRQRLGAATLGAIIVNNKISNVCAPGGVEASERVCAETARLLQLGASQILPSSTGVIGWGLPVEAMITALPSVTAALAPGSILPAAEGIVTTDLYPKIRRATVGGGSIVGIAKGAGMIEPNMATMLVYVLTDIAIPRATLRAMLTRVVNTSFNTISVDSDTSTSDTVALANELTAWKAIFEESPAKAAGVELVTLPGNHEVQDAKKVAYAAAERTWLRLMAPYLTRGGNGPRAGGADTLRTDQSRLSYSFDFRDAHFLTLNTDPVGADWTVPAQWAASDLAAAKARGARHIFAISHKPAYEYPGAPGDGLSRFPAIRDAFWHAMTSAGADAMLSSHNHVWWAGRPAAGGPWQIIAGNGGSKLQVVQTVPGSGNYSGFTYVMVMNSGRVVAWSYGRDVSNPYNAPSTPGSSLRETVIIR